MRLDKFLSAAGECSRRDCAREVRGGLILIDGKPARSPSDEVTPGVSCVVRHGAAVEYRENIYIMLNKPEGYVSATEDKKDGCPVVNELCDVRYRDRVFPCGRLDKYTVGLMLLTDDGELCHRLLSPARHVDKTYRFSLRDELTDQDISRLEGGVYIEGGYLTARCTVKREVANTGTITISEGKYHQIKQMMYAVGNHVEALERISFGPLKLDEKLQRGEVRYLTEAEVGELFFAAGLKNKK